MKSVLSMCLLLCLSSTPLAAQSRLQNGTIVRMEMGDCITPEHGFMAALAGSSHIAGEGLCPEYVLVGNKVVYVIVGRTSASLVPLAELTKFRIQNNELLIRIDDARRETRFAIREMVLRSEWDRVHPQMMEAVETDSRPHHLDSALLLGQEH